MDRRDQELLDRQLKVVSRSPRNGILSLGLVFLAGIAIGGILFAQESKRMQIASHEGSIAIAQLKGMSPIMR
jgi:hypothetical protein